MSEHTPPQPLTPGVQTTEWSATAVMLALTLLANAGVIAFVDVTKLYGALMGCVLAAASFWASARVIVEYIRSRVAVKTAQLPGRIPVAQHDP